MIRAICRNAICLVIALTAVPLVVADEKAEWKALKGSWIIDKATLMGKDQTAIFKSAVLTVDKGKYTLNFGGNEDKGTLKIDPAAKPKRITITGIDGPSKGKTLEAIYAIDGDTFKVCYALDGKAAPKALESKEGTNTLYIVYKQKNRRTRNRAMKSMARTPVVTAIPDDDRQRDAALRPKFLREVIGQTEVARRLAIAVNAAKKLKEPLGHILFDGPPGLGKTTFATVLPHELGTSIQMTSGPALSKPADLLPFLTNLEERSILFIDEIHRTPRVVEEFIYPAMEDFRVDIVLGEGMNARTISLNLKRFTLIGATTRQRHVVEPDARPLQDAGTSRVL